MKEDQEKFLVEVRSCRLMLLKLVALYADELPEREDLAQEILLQAWKAWPRFRGEAKFSTWFYRICLNTILTHQRKNRPQTLPPREDLVAAPATHDTPDLQALHWAIRQLGETDRALITMNLEGYDHTEIAAVFGLSNNHVAVKLNRIKKQLTKLIQNEHGDIQQKELRK
jgi:RNA polymerase sigma factor (sigma-70 family)